MKKSFSFFNLTLTTFFLINATAQDGTRVVSNTISATDKTAILQVFKDVGNPDIYTLRFYGDRTIYGSKRISATELEQIKKLAIPSGQKGIIVNYRDRMIIYFRDGSIIYVSSMPTRTGRNEILNLLGATGTSKLKIIMGRYVDDPNIVDNPDLVDNPEIIDNP